ncbi:MAG TPA: 5'/3'-nucleotidase SurE [Sporichthya sp.]|nr:5'/3'-nucleotidase SurE [Sporichthya sp.]
MQRQSTADTTTARPPVALITNDDGIGSEGLRQLALVAAEAGCRVVVAAPMSESSGSSSSITATEADGCLLIEQRSVPGLEGHSVWAVGGLPAYIALVATRGAFGDKPDLILSGINDGPNTGHAILHSGTVGAALTAAGQGIRSLAVSLAVGTERHWQSGAEFARRVLPALIGSPPGTALNLNVPNLPLEGIRGIREAPLASFGAVQTNILKSGEGFVQIGLSEIDPTSEPDSDAALLARGWATLTALRPVCEAADVDIAGLVAGLHPAGASQ